jgi:hypothetical protein
MRFEDTRKTICRGGGVPDETSCCLHMQSTRVREACVMNTPPQTRKVDAVHRAVALVFHKSLRPTDPPTPTTPFNPLLPPSKLAPSKKGSEVPGKTSSCLCHKARAGAINTLAYTHTRCARRTRDPSTLRVERLTPRQAAARVRASQRCAHPSRACPSRAHPTSVPHHHCVSVGEGRVRSCARGCRTRAPSLVRRVL